MVDLNSKYFGGGMAAKPPKKATQGNKIYVSSKVMDALKHMRKHTYELSIKRT